MNVQPFSISPQAINLRQLNSSSPGRTLINKSSLFQLIFAIICAFYDGCPYYVAVIIGILLLIDATVIFIFCKCRPTRGWLVSFLFIYLFCELYLFISNFLYLWYLLRSDSFENCYCICQRNLFLARQRY
ncbi:unnamed protein product [Nippostrongylus brasiliensis]|uniref:Uncharacterized protein n=1 Tax=Nippostrongylus brasiliensis TaxID=27835 RepID=A0A0N4XFT5_NIPBR|nr:unnamed protein product [Nippostrongylus brasiliensis]